MKKFKNIKEGDTLIVCGDFGFVWDNSKIEQKILKKLGNKKYTLQRSKGLGENTKEMLTDFSDALTIVVVGFIQFAPIGIMSLVFTAVSQNGLSIFVEYGELILLLVGCMIFTALIVYPLIVAIILRRNPYPLLYICLKESSITAFFTRSSAANIPVNMILCEKLGLNLYMPPLSLCGDNGAMVGAQAYYEFKAGNTAGLDLNALSAYSIEKQLC